MRRRSVDDNEAVKEPKPEMAQRGAWRAPVGLKPALCERNTIQLLAIALDIPFRLLPIPQPTCGQCSVASSTLSLLVMLTVSRTLHSGHVIREEQLTESDDSPLGFAPAPSI